MNLIVVPTMVNFAASFTTSRDGDVIVTVADYTDLNIPDRYIQIQRWTF